MKRSRRIYHQAFRTIRIISPHRLHLEEQGFASEEIRRTRLESYPAGSGTARPAVHERSYEYSGKELC